MQTQQTSLSACKQAIAWVDFLAKLDRENAEIVCEYVAQESDWYGYNS